jgi:hypothetical protein
MTTFVSTLLKNICHIFDNMLNTSIPLEIKRRNRKRQNIPAKLSGKLNNLKKHRVLNCKPEEIIHLDWLEEWKPL